MPLAAPAPQHVEHAEYGNGVDEKHGPRSGGDDDEAGQRGSHRPRDIDRDAAESHGRRELVRRDGLGDNRLPCGKVDRVARTNGERNDEQHPGLDNAQECQDSERRRGGKQPHLRSQQHAPAVEDVGDRARR